MAFFYMNLVLRKQKPFWNPHSLLQAGFPSVSWDRIWARSSARCSVGKVTMTHSDAQHTAWAGGGWAFPALMSTHQGSVRKVQGSKRSGHQSQ